MTLRRQLLLVSLLLLALPWAGCQFIREMEGALRHGQEQYLQATARAVAAVVGARETLLYPYPRRRTAPADQRPSLYAHSASRPIIVDGYGDGWEDIPAGTFSAEPDAPPLAVDYRAATREGNLYLLLQVRDPEVVFHNPGISAEPNGDRLVLRTWQEGRRQEYVIATAAPGSVRASPASRRQPGADAGRIRGYWQDATGGYSLELELPLAYTGGRLGFYLVNVGRRAGGGFDTLGNVAPLDSAAPPWLIYSPQALQDTLAPFGDQGSHIQVIDNSGWLIADMPAKVRPRDSEMPDTFWLLKLLYRSILSRDELQPPPAGAGIGRVTGTEIDGALAGRGGSQRYADPVHGTRTLLSAATPISHEEAVIGAVVVRQSGEQYLSLTDRAFSRLLAYSLLVLGASALGLLAYASLLSWRIGRLSRAARNASREDGPPLQAFPRSRARDEIGELSRHYADLLDRLQEYNDYLRTLSRKLSHELRTPIAVIQTSLENLEGEAGTSREAATYVARAREGLARLTSMLTAMSEANRLEESLRGNLPREIDLVPLVADMFEAYRRVYPRHSLALDLQADRAPVTGVPELIVQALDKLMDNAASFCPPGGNIRLRLAPSAGGWELGVSNEGPALPRELQDRLFDPMVSLRDGDAGDVHLGLGLHIVRLITEFHRGRVSAANLEDNRGVYVGMQLPRSPGQASAAVS